MIPSTVKKINEKMKEQIKESDISLLFELNLEPSERQFIRDNSATILGYALDGVARFRLTACYYMMDVGMRTYDDGMYWDNFWELSNLGKRTSAAQSKLSAMFESTIKDYDLAWIDRGGRTYVNMILMHALIPDGYSSSFFDFMHLFYNTVLNGSLDGMEQALNNLADDTSVDNSEDEGEIFERNLIIPMKLAFSDISIFGSMAKKILRKIDSPEDTEGENLGVHEDSFNKWVTKKLADNSAHGTFGDRIRLYFDRESTAFKIFVPEIAFHGRGDPYAHISDGEGNLKGKVYLDERMFKGYTFTNPKMINLCDYGLNPLDDIIVTAGNKRFESVDTDYIIFSNNGFSSRNISRGLNFIARKHDVTIYEETSTLYEDDETVVDILYLERGNSVKIDDKSYFIHKPLGDFFDISDNEMDLICKDHQENEISLYSRHPSLSLELEENKLDLLRLTVWKDNIEIKNLNFEVCREHVPEGYHVSFGDKVNIEMDLETILKGYGEGIYRFKFNRSSRSVNYLYIPGFTCTFDKKIYYGENGYLVINWNINNRIDFKSFNQETVSFPFETKNGRIYEVIAEIPSFRYSFNKKDWMIFDSKRYYYRTLNSNRVYVKTPNKDEGYLSISVPGAKPLNGQFVDGYNVFELREITKLAEYIKEDRIDVYYNWGAGWNKSEKMFPISINAEYSIYDDSIKVIKNLAGDVSYRLVVQYKDGNTVTVPFVDFVAEFDNEGFESINVQEVIFDDFGGEDTKEVNLIPKEINLELDSSNIKRSELPERIGYKYGKYEGELNPKYFEFLIVGDRYNEERREENLNDFFMKNAYGNKMPDLMARKLYSEIESQILNIQTETYDKHYLIGLFNRYVKVRGDLARVVFNRLEKLFPDDSTVIHLAMHL